MPPIRKKINTTTVLNLKENLQERFIAFLDVMGFSNLVNRGNVDNLESYFEKITEVLDKLKQDKADIQAFLISDSIILIAPIGQDGFVQLLHAVRRIQSSLLWRKILLRGAISHGQVYYNDKRNILVGKGYIKAYLLEQEATYPRVIIDPSIITQLATDKADFIAQINGSIEYTFEDRLIYTRSQFSEIKDDGIFVDYANKTILKNGVSGNLKKIYEVIVDNLYSEQKLYGKYVWLREYFLEILHLTKSALPVHTPESKGSAETTRTKKSLDNWIQKFERL